MKTKIFFLTLLLTSLCTYNAHAYDIIIGGIKYNYANTAGDGLEWYKVDNSSNGTLSRDRFSMSTDQRYPVPHVLSINNKYNTESGVRLYFKTNINQIDLSNNDDKEELLNSYYEHFHIDEDGKFGYKYLRIKPTIDNPDASIDEKWTNYEITELDKTNGYIDITGLSSNSMYMADVIDPTVESQYDATYNTVLFRTDAKVSEPIILNHEELMTQYEVVSKVTGTTSFWLYTSYIFEGAHF